MEVLLMCADNFSGRHAKVTGRHRRDRQLPVAQTARLIDDGSAWPAVPPPTSPPARSAHYVGRVGALAVALGVGAAIFGSTTVAAADTGAPDTTGSAGQESDAGATAGAPTRKTQAGNRRTPRRAAADASPAPADAVDVPATKPAPRGGVSRTAPPRRRSEGAPFVVPGRVARPSAVDTPAAAAGLPSSPGAQVLASVLGGKAPASVRTKLNEIVTTVLKDAISAVAANAGLPGAGAVPQLSAGGTPQGAPVMRALATLQRVLATDGGALSLLGFGSGGGSPSSSPLSWASLAVARRQDLAGPAPQVAPAAAVGTAETVADPVVGATRTITITGVFINGVAVNSAPPNTEITITGTNFTATYPAASVSLVYFGCDNKAGTNCGSTGQKATVVKGSVEKGSLKVVVPQDAKSGYVQVFADTSPVSWSSYSTESFTVDASTNAPTITEVNPTSGVSKVAGAVTITGTNFVPNTDAAPKATTVTFGCSANACGTKSVAATNVVVNPDGKSLTADYPAELPKNGTLDGNIQVVTKGGTVYSTTTFKLNNPSITSIDTTGYWGSSLTINGSYLAGATKVTFAGGADGNGVSVLPGPDGFTVIDGQSKQSQIQVSAIPVGTSGECHLRCAREVRPV
ncbi:MAG: IPT/TIG domain-containing protein, partial [Mycobacterium sp.]